MLLTIFSSKRSFENLLPNFAGSSPPISPKNFALEIAGAYTLQIAIATIFHRIGSNRKPQKERDFCSEFAEQHRNRWRWMEGGTDPKKTPTQIKTKFAQTMSELPLFPSKQAKLGRMSLRKLFMQTFLFGWVVFWVGRLPLRFLACDGSSQSQKSKVAQFR